MESETDSLCCTLPPEIITDILSRLPVKSLLKFRSVSRSWLSLISSPEFIKIHLHLSVVKKEYTHHVLILDNRYYEYKWAYQDCSLASLFYNSVTEALDLDYPVENDDSSYNLTVYGSCNGLIFLALGLEEYSLIWNPTIRKYKTLHIFRPRRKNCDPIYGFGYDELHDDYKIVVVFYFYDDYNCIDDAEVKVYSLTSDSWTSIDFCGELVIKRDGYYKETLSVSLFVDGKLHWDTVPSPNPPVPSLDYPIPGRSIISFDLANGKWEKVEKPSLGVGETEWGVVILGSDLSVLHDYKQTHLDIWVMKEYGVKESWIKMFTIMYSNELCIPPFFMSSKGEILSVYGETFMIYNSKDGSFRYPNVTNCHNRQFAHFYIESLVCPFSTEGTENAAKERKIEKIE